MQPNTTWQDSGINCHESTEVESAWGKRSGERRSWVRGSITLECATGATSFPKVNHFKYNRVSVAELSFKKHQSTQHQKAHQSTIKNPKSWMWTKSSCLNHPDLPSHLTLHCSLAGSFTRPSSADRRAFVVSVSLSETLLPSSSYGSLPRLCQGSAWCHPVNEAFSGHPI